MEEKKIVRIMFLCSIFLLEGCWWSKKKIEPKDDVGITVINETEDTVCVNNTCPGEIIVDIAPEDETMRKVDRLSIFENGSENDGILSTEELPKDNFDDKRTPITLLLSDDADLDVSIEHKGNSTSDISDKLNQMHVGVTHFAFDRFKAPINNDYAELKNIVALINAKYAENNNIKVLITGHSCNWAGSEKYNLQLSDKRALMVSKYILKHTSLSRDNVMHYGCGTSQLLGDGDKEQQSVNRRAEIFICE